MRRVFIMCMMYFTAAVVTCGVLAADNVAGQGQGWTGITKPQDLILARESLMVELEELMKPIDTYTVDNTISTETVTANAKTISAILLAVPHLFPPTTNLYDPRVDQPKTLALPKIWEDFPAFYGMATATSQVADKLAHTTDAAALHDVAVDLREACETCHETFELPYHPHVPTAEELKFDFDSVFKK